MDESKNKANVPPASPKKEAKYGVATLKRMPELKGYNQDLLTALLTKPEYSVKEALSIVKKYLKED